MGVDDQPNELNPEPLLHIPHIKNIDIDGIDTAIINSTISLIHTDSAVAVMVVVVSSSRAC